MNSNRKSNRKSKEVKLSTIPTDHYHAFNNKIVTNNNVNEAVTKTSVHMELFVYYI